MKLYLTLFYFVFAHSALITYKNELDFHLKIMHDLNLRRAQIKGHKKIKNIDKIF